MGSYSSKEGKERTLIRVRRAQAEPRAIWAGATLQASFATLKSWMAASNFERMVSGIFDRDFEAIDNTGGRREEGMRHGGHEEILMGPGRGRLFCLVQT